jgi:hypothetical protein
MINERMQNINILKEVVPIFTILLFCYVIVTC